MATPRRSYTAIALGAIDDALAQGSKDSALALALLLTHRGKRAVPGLLQLGAAGLAETTGLSEVEARRALKDLFDQGRIMVDGQARPPLVYVNRAVLDDPPRTKNAVLGMHKQLSELRDCPITVQIRNEIDASLRALEKESDAKWLFNYWTALNAPDPVTGPESGSESGPETPPESRPESGNESGAESGPLRTLSLSQPPKPTYQQPPHERDARVRVGPPLVDPNLTNATVTERAGRFCERYADFYEKHRQGAKYRPSPMKDYQSAVSLCGTWTDDERLDKLAIVFLTTDHQFAESGSRTITQFAALASWCDGKLAEWEASRARVSA